MTRAANAVSPELPEDPEHRFYSVPDYPDYSGICECGRPLGPRATREALHRDYRAHFGAAAVSQDEAVRALSA